MSCPLPNENKTDRIIRFVMAIALALLAQFWLAGIWKDISYILAVAVLATSVSGYCGLYAVLGLRTNSN